MAKTPESSPPSNEARFINIAAAAIRLYMARVKGDPKARLLTDVIEQHSLFGEALCEQEREHIAADFFDDAAEVG